MNFLSDNLTSRENINIFSTPRFRQILFDKNKNVKLPSLYGTVSQDLIFQKDSNNNEKNNISKNKSKEQIYFKDKDNFSLSSLTMMSGNTEKNQITINNINDSNTYTNKTKEKEDKNENGLFSFCDKSENYSFNNDINSKEKENISKNKSEKKSEINKNLFIENSNNINENISNNSNIKNEKNYKESQMMSGNSNQNSSSFQYNLPLENDKTPAIKDFFAFQDINIDEKDNKTIEEKSLSLDINKDIKKNKSIKMINKKSNLLFQYKANNTTNTSVRKVRKSQTQKFYSSHNKSISLVKKINYINNDSDNNPINRSALARNIKNKNKSKNLVIKKNILHSYDNYNNKVKKIIKVPPKDEDADKDKDNSKKILLSQKGNSRMVSPKKKLEIIIKHTEICMNNYVLNRMNDGTYGAYNIKQMNSNSSFEPKNRNSLQSELDYEVYKNKKLKNNFSIKEHNYNKYNTIMYTYGNTNTNANDKSECSNSTNKVKNKSRKFIKSSTLDFCNNPVFNFNKFKSRGDSNNINKVTINIANKKVNMTNKSNSNFSKNIKKENKDKKIMDNKKYSYHTRNISNLHSNKISNGIKGIFNNNDIIFKTINYEAGDLKKKVINKNILESQIKTKSKIKIKKISPLPKFNSKNANLNSTKEKSHLYFRNSNFISNPNSNRTTNNFNGRYNNTVLNRDKNSKDKKILNVQRKIKPNNLVKSKISSFNEIKSFLLNKTKNIIKIENKNQSTNKLTNNKKINIPNTERLINENYSSVNLDSKSISDSVFINVNDSTNSLQNVGDSRINKIKVNTINMHKRIIKELSSNNNNKNSSFWKIHKKSKNSCLLNSYNNKDIKKLEYISNTNNSNSNISNNVTSLGSSYEKHIKVNSQIINFNKNKAKKNHDYNLVHHSILTNNSKSVITDYSYTERNNNSISDNLNVEKIKEEIRNNQNICKLYQSKKDVCLTTLNDNNSSEMPMNDIFSNTTITNSNDYNNSNDGKFTSYNRDEIIKYSILRNNQNNQIINEFSVILGDEKKNDKKINNNESKNDKIEKTNISSDGKRTIINVNQYYPSYYINTNNAHEILKTNNDIKK